MSEPGSVFFLIWHRRWRFDGESYINIGRLADQFVRPVNGAVGLPIFVGGRAGLGHLLDNKKKCGMVAVDNAAVELLTIFPNFLTDIALAARQKKIHRFTACRPVLHI